MEGEKRGILGVGVATMDIYVNRGRMYPGGNEYNVACNARFLGSRAGFLGVFGDDRFGPILEDTLKSCGVETAFCRHEKGSSGYSLVELKEDGDRVFLDWNRQGVTDLYPIAFTAEELEYVKSYQVVSVGRCSTVTAEKVELLHRNGVDVCYDFHAIFSEQEISAFAPYSRYAFFSCSHLSWPEIRTVLTDTVRRGCSIAVATRGVLPVLAYDGETWYEQETFPAERVVDALGAGDSFIGAFLHCYLSSAEREERERIRTALRGAAEHAAKVVTIEGSIGVGMDLGNFSLLRASSTSLHTF